MKDLEFIGIGCSYALDLGGNCAYLKENEKLLLIDCCESATKKLVDKKAFEGVKEIIIAITHTHADHISGLGTLIWYCNFLLNIKPKIVRNSSSFENTLKSILTLSGVSKKHYEFIDAKTTEVGGVKIQMMPTTHSPKLECYGVMFSDDFGLYYYTGDTNDFENIKKLALDKNVKKIYTEASNESYGVHIAYKDLKTIKRDKLVLMHFEDIKLLETAKKDGFNVAKLK
ncbi:MAG: MBL fold metallo-hydrolase [Clostridia bacterium]|nr:MBL fold metallo-hydrolase [Clostridia bacterium]